MGEQKKPQAGEWWFATSNPGDRLYIVGQCDTGQTVFQYVAGGQLLIDRDGNWKNWHHEPRCTGWEWQPEPEPKWFDLTPLDGHVLRNGIDEVFLDEQWAYAGMYSGISVRHMKSAWSHTKFRCLLKDAPKPAEDPDEWVTQDRVPYRKGVDEFRWLMECGTPIWQWSNLETNVRMHGYKDGIGQRFEVRCRRRDLPPIPEPKPATQTIVFHEVIRTWDDYYEREEKVLLLTANPGAKDVKTGRTETREVVR